MTGIHESSSWRWLRRLFLLTLWLGVLAAATGIGLGWRRAPGTFLGVGWIWFAGLAWLALALMALDATLEIGSMPLPPEIPPDQEVRHWLLFLIAGPTVAALFAFVVSIPVVISHRVLKTFAAWDPRWRGLLLFALWMAWLIGTLGGLAALQNLPVVTALRRTLRRRVLGLHVSEARILALLEACDLPSHVKTIYIRRLQRHGMTRRTALELLKDLKAHPPQGSPSIQRALLTQALYNWLEEQIKD